MGEPGAELPGEGPETPPPLPDAAVPGAENPPDPDALGVLGFEDDSGRRRMVIRGCGLVVVSALYVRGRNGGH